MHHLGNGEWLITQPDEPAETAAAVRVRASGNNDHQAALARERSAARARLGLGDKDPLPADEDRAAVARACTGTIFTGWRNYCREDGTTYPDCRGAMTPELHAVGVELWGFEDVQMPVSAAASKLADRLYKLGEGILGNSKAGSAGSSGTAG